MKNLSLITFFIACLLLPGCTTRSNKESGPAYEAAITHYGNTSGNTANNGFAVIHDHWIYFSNEDNEGYIYKMHVDGTNPGQINSNNSKYLNQYEDWIYYSNLDSKNHLYRINIDGSGEEALRVGAAGNIRAENVLIVDEWLYYKNLDENDRIYRLSLTDEVLEQVTEDSVDQFYTDNEWIYFISSYDINTKKIYKTKIGSSSSTQLNAHHSRDLIISGDWIYYTGQDTAFPEPSYIYKMRKDGSENTLVCQVNAASLNISGDWLYFSNWDDNHRLYRVHTDGTELTPLTSDHAQTINIVGERIIYKSRYEEKSIYKIRTDGNEKINVFNGSIGTIVVNEDYIYFSSKTGMYRITTNGDELYKINADKPGSFNVAGDYLFYNMNGIYMVKTDQSSREKLTQESAIGINVAGQWLFYKEYNPTRYKMVPLSNKLTNSSSTGNQSRGNSNGNLINDGYAAFYNGWIYYIYSEEADDESDEIYNTYIYKMKPDGNSQTKVTERGFYAIRSLNVYNGWIYFINYPGSLESYIYRMRIDGSDYSQVNWFHQDSACCLTVVNDWIYYIGTNGLFKMRIDGRERRMVVNDSSAYNLNVSGEWIYFISEDRKKEKLIKLTDLEGNQIIINN